MGDDETPAGDPTELAGTATADTESVYAWAVVIVELATAVFCPQYAGR